jgi:hypothetical protein
MLYPLSYERPKERTACREGLRNSGPPTGLARALMRKVVLNMLFLIGFAYLLAAAVFYTLVCKVAPVAEEPVWHRTAPPRSSQVVELFQSERRLAA